jgi:hypothetical protein
MADKSNGAKLQSLSEDDWKFLIRRIKDQKCTPIIGPGAYTEFSPLNVRIVESWTSSRPDYPFKGYYEIGRVAQFMSVVAPDPLVPKDDFIKQYKGLAAPDFGNPDEPHRVLASLPLPVYITTNYDDFMFQALSKRPDKDKTPIREFCRWNKSLQDYKTVDFEENPPTVANPVVYHLHGYSRLADSLVLTDDDYLDFLVNISEDDSLIPERIQRSMTGCSLLLLGYQLDDWNFRVLFRSIVSFLQKGLERRAHVSVQLVPKYGDQVTQEQVENAQTYFERYFGIRKVKVYWGTCQQFVVELRERWEASSNDE